MRRAIHHHRRDVYLRYVGREASAAPAAGYMALHVAQQEEFINQALAADKSANE
jgi:2-oxoglutarate dehydrogenase E1 component